MVNILSRHAAAGIILCMRQANERWRYIVTSSERRRYIVTSCLIDGVHTQNDSYSGPHYHCKILWHDVVCLLWWGQGLLYVLHLQSPHGMQYHVIIDHATASLPCNKKSITQPCLFVAGALQIANGVKILRDVSLHLASPLWKSLRDYWFTDMVFVI